MLLSPGRRSHHGFALEKAERCDGTDVEALLSAASRKPSVLEGYSDRVVTRRFEKAAARSSLNLLYPDDLWWWVREERGKVRYRANFRMGDGGRMRYDLPVTDPAWLDQLHLLPYGIYPNRMMCGERDRQTLLTASLSEPFEGFHYKLIAGVVHLPA